MQGTVVESAYVFINGGCLRLARQGVVVVGRWCGGEQGEQRVASCFDGVTEWACVRLQGPALQALYGTLFAGGVYVYQTSCAQVLLANPFIPSYHHITAYCGCLVALFCFLMASTCAPGSITKANMKEYMEAYPFDGHLWTKGKVISELGVLRPARSKYDPIGGVLIPKFDHYCPWVNNCIGQQNMRWFLAFLLSNTVLCCYAMVLVAATLYYEVQVNQMSKLN